MSFSRIVIQSHTIRIPVRGAEIVLDFHVIDSWYNEVGTISEDGILSEYEIPKTRPKNWAIGFSIEIEKLVAV